MLYVHFCRDFLGATVSGVVTEHGSFSCTMTYYAIGCFASAGLVLLIRIFQWIIKCSNSSQSPKMIEKDHERTPLLNNFLEEVIF